MQREHDKLSAEVVLEDKTTFFTATAALAASQQDQALAKRLKEQLDRFTRHNAGGRRQLAQLQHQANILQAKLAQQRRALGGVDATREQDRAAAKRVHRLENQLEKALGKLNEALARNKEKKASIDDLRRERLIFMQVQQKLQKELDDKLAKMAEVIEACNKAYEARDTAQAEAVALEEADRKETLDCEAQLQELAHVFKAKLRRTAMRPNLLMHGHGATATQRRLTLLQAADAKEEKAQRKREAQRMEEERKEYAAFLEEVQAHTGHDDVEALLEEYLRQEERNFSLYTYVNQEQWRELKAVEAQVAELRAELAKEAVIGEEEEEDDSKEEEEEDEEEGTHLHSGHPHHALPSSLELQLHATEDAIHRYEDECGATQQTLDMVRRGIASLTTFLRLDGMDVTNGNLLLCLGRVEERMEEVVKAYQVAKKAKAAKERQQQQPSSSSSSTAGGGSSSMFKILRLMAEPEEPPVGEEEKDVVLQDGMAAAGAGNSVERLARQRRHHHHALSSHIDPPRVDDYSDKDNEGVAAAAAQKPMTPPPSMPGAPTGLSPRPLTRAQVEESLKKPTGHEEEEEEEEEDTQRGGAGGTLCSAIQFSIVPGPASAMRSTSSSPFPSSAAGAHRKAAKRMSHFFKSFDD